MAMRMYELEYLQHIWEPTRDSRVALAWSRTTVVLAFRGTASLKNAETDLKVWSAELNSPMFLRRQCNYNLLLSLTATAHVHCHGWRALTRSCTVTISIWCMR